MNTETHGAQPIVELYATPENIDAIGLRLWLENLASAHLKSESGIIFPNDYDLDDLIARASGRQLIAWTKARTLDEMANYGPIMGTAEIMEAADQQKIKMDPKTAHLLSITDKPLFAATKLLKKPFQAWAKGYKLQGDTPSMQIVALLDSPEGLIEVITNYNMWSSFCASDHNR
jgi:hypothetical protein